MSEHEATYYRWNQMPQDHPMERIARRTILGEQAMLAEIQVARDCHVPTHSHANEQFVYVIEGALRIDVGEASDPDRKQFVVRAGEVLHLPGGLPHSATALENTRVLDVFSPPSRQTGLDQADGD